MSRLRLMGVCFLLVAGLSDVGPVAGQAPAAQDQVRWKLAFSDEFDRPGAPDAAKWGYELGYIRNKEAQYYTSRPENARVERGNLVIEARKEAREGYAYTSASLNTLGRFQFLYGRVEVRAAFALDMRDYGVKPPVRMLGALRVAPEVEVGIHLVFGEAPSAPGP